MISFLALILVLLVVILLVLIAIEYRSSHTVVSIRAVNKLRLEEGERCEQEVARALARMDAKSYVLFNNLILRSNGNTPHTEIDHVVVSPYGIFCIETKSHRGSIYGYTNATHWVQYLGGKSFRLYNPCLQNYKHKKALQGLLRPYLRTDVHTYVVFPYAQRVKINGKDQDLSIETVISRITAHHRQVYNLRECESILKTLAYASARRKELSAIHSSEVQLYLARESHAL